METRDSVLVFAKKTGEYLTASNGETVVEKRKRKKVEKTGKSGNKLFSFAVWEAILEAVKSKYGEDGLLWFKTNAKVKFNGAVVTKELFGTLGKDDICLIELHCCCHTGVGSGCISIFTPSNVLDHLKYCSKVKGLSGLIRLVLLLI